MRTRTRAPRLGRVGVARPNPRRAPLDPSPWSSLAYGWRYAKWSCFAGGMGTTGDAREDERDAAAERASQSYQARARLTGCGFRTLGRSVGGVSLGRAGRSARYHRSGRVRPLNWRAGLARGPHRPVRTTNRGGSVRGHRVDRPDPGQGDGHDCWDLARDACAGGRAEFGESRRLSAGLAASRRWRSVDGEHGRSVTDAADEEVGCLSVYSAPRVRALAI